MIQDITVIVSPPITENVIITPPCSTIITISEVGIQGPTGPSGINPSGIFYPLNSNPNGYLTGFNSGDYTLNSNTGNFITSDQTGNFSSSVPTGNLTGAFYPLTGNPSQYANYNYIDNLLSGSIISGEIGFTGMGSVTISSQNNLIIISGRNDFYNLIQDTAENGGTTDRTYIALISQSGINPPVANVLSNTLSGEIIWTYNSSGNYSGTLTGAFPITGTFFSIGDMNSRGFMSIETSSVNAFSIGSRDFTITPANNIFNYTSLKIQVYGGDVTGDVGGGDVNTYPPIGFNQYYYSDTTSPAAQYWSAFHEMGGISISNESQSPITISNITVSNGNDSISVVGGFPFTLSTYHSYKDLTFNKSLNSDVGIMSIYAVGYTLPFIVNYSY